MTRASKEIYLNVDKLNQLPDAVPAQLDPTDRLLLRTEFEAVNIPLGMLQDFAVSEFAGVTETLEIRADDFENRITAIEENGGTGTGGTDGPDKYLSYEQVNPADQWIITHSLAKYPSVTVIDSANTLIIGAVSYPDLNTVQIDFAGAMAGRAFLN